jgi:ribonuclease P protein component
VTYLYLTNENTPARAGLIIRKNVGGSVVRHRVARQIRHTLQDHLHALPTGALLVVRALPTSSATIKGAIHHELTELILRLLEKARVTQ